MAGPLRLRFGLDEGFPDAVGWDPGLVDALTEYVPLRRFAPNLVGKETPDWIVILTAYLDGLNGLVTDDGDMLNDDMSLTALSSVDFSLVTWIHGMDDNVTRWGQIVAYMPEIRKAIARTGATVFVLPAPRLSGRGSKETAWQRLQERASRRGDSPRTVRATTVALMNQEARQRRLRRISDFLSRL